MTAETVFSIASTFAFAGWLVLAYAVTRRKAWLRDVIAGQAWPLALSALYAILVAFFFASSPGGFDSLANVQLLFTAPWAALAGWVHYLAFDLFVGAFVARMVMEAGLPRLTLVLLLPLTFLFGPAGLLASYVLRLTLAPISAASAS